VLQVLRDGSVIASVPVSGEDFRHEMTVDGRGDYRLQVMRGSAVDALTTPITLGRAPEAADRPVAGSPSTRARPRLRVRVRPRRVRAGRRVRYVVRVRAARRPARGARVRFAGTRRTAGRRGRVVVRKRLARPGRHRVRATLAGHRRGRAVVRVTRRR
jgi:hypothetical protein